MQGPSRRSGSLCAFAALLLASCAGKSIPIAADCSTIVPGQVAHYDAYTQQFLNTVTSEPPDNLAGAIVWGARYYLESLLDAYEATGNAKYMQAFVDTGTVVINQVQTLTLVNVADPSAPGSTIDSPAVDETGWPTQLDSFSESVAVPTTDGQTSLYAQTFGPINGVPEYPLYLQIAQQAGGLTLAWTNSDEPLQSYSVASEADLANMAAAPLVEGQSYGRIKPTGLGLPAPGTYEVDSPITTIWHEQTAGILLPFVRFLLLAKEDPKLADPTLVANWQSQVSKIAAGYVDEFASDGNGGLIFQNPVWLPNLAAGTPAAADYVSIEAEMRMFLYALTGDSSQLAIAQGLIAHQRNYNWQKSSSGWLLLKYWPDMVPWSTHAEAPIGSIWDVYTFDTTLPAPVEDAATFVQLFHEAGVLGLAGALDIPPVVYASDRSTLAQYLYADPRDVANRTGGLLRGAYPTAASTPNDPPSTAEYSFSSAWYVSPEIAGPAFVAANWKWMLQFAQDPQDAPVGYFLRAWARSEAAEAAICKEQ